MSSDVFAAALLKPDLPVPNFITGKAQRRFAVYRNNVVVGLMRAMESNFPAIRSLLGKSYFAGLAREFVQQHPPQSPLMFEYGSSFPSYLATQQDLRRYPYLADVAQIEILMRESHHASDAPVLDPDVLAQVPEHLLGDLILKPHPALRLLSSEFSVVAITLCNRSGAAELVKSPDVAEWALVTRPELVVTLISVSHAQFVFIKSLAMGNSLEGSTNKAFRIDIAFDLASTLSLVLAQGVFTSLEPQDLRK